MPHDHHAIGPGWWCTGCPELTPWPCENTRTRINHDGRAAAVMSVLMWQATGELPDLTGEQLAERFMTWTTS